MAFFHTFELTSETFQEAETDASSCFLRWLNKDMIMNCIWRRKRIQTHPLPYKGPD
jgi:hypothetical protein